MSGRYSLQIFLDRPSATYNRGDTVSGRVEVETPTPKPIRGIAIKFKGKAKVFWHNPGSKSTYEGKQLLMERNAQLIPTINGEMLLAAGKHSFPFTVTLEDYLPNSYESTSGCIRYTVRARMDPLIRFNMKAKVMFVVLSPLDLNLEANVQFPVRKTKTTELCGIFCSPGNIKMTVTVPYTAFVNGQDIPMLVELNNASSKTVDVKCYIWQLAKYIVKTHEHYEGGEMCSLYIGRATSHSTAVWSSKLQVPTAATQSFLRPCSLIDLEYYLHVRVHIPGAQCSMTVRIPIVIGTIPLTRLQSST